MSLITRFLVTHIPHKWQLYQIFDWLHWLQSCSLESQLTYIWDKLHNSTPVSHFAHTSMYTGKTMYENQWKFTRNYKCMSCSLYYNLAEYKSRSRVCYEIVMLAVTYIVIRIFRSFFFSLVTPPYHINNTHFQIILIIFFFAKTILYQSRKTTCQRWRCVCFHTALAAPLILYHYTYTLCVVSVCSIHIDVIVYAEELGEKRLPSGCLKSIFIFVFSIFFVEISLWLKMVCCTCICVYLVKKRRNDEWIWIGVLLSFFFFWSVQWSVVCRCCV